MDGVERRVCETSRCGFVHWNNPVPVVAALVQYGNQIVLARNVLWPEGRFSLVTGYLEMGESPESAVVREVKEELGLDSHVQELIGCYVLSEKNQVILAYGVVASGQLSLGDEIADFRLLSRDELSAWSFGPLSLSATIVKQWLENTQK